MAGLRSETSYLAVMGKLGLQNDLRQYEKGPKSS